MLDGSFESSPEWDALTVTNYVENCSLRDKGGFIHCLFCEIIPDITRISEAAFDLWAFWRNTTSSLPTYITIQKLISTQFHAPYNGITSKHFCHGA